MTYAPVAGPRHHWLRHRRHRFSVQPGALAAAAFILIAVALVTITLVNGLPQLDPQAQMFVVP